MFTLRTQNLLFQVPNDRLRMRPLHLSVRRVMWLRHLVRMNTRFRSFPTQKPNGIASIHIFLVFHCVRTKIDSRVIDYPAPDLTSGIEFDRLFVWFFFAFSRKTNAIRQKQ